MIEHPPGEGLSPESEAQNLIAWYIGEAEQLRAEITVYRTTCGSLDPEQALLNLLHLEGSLELFLNTIKNDLLNFEGLTSNGRNTLRELYTGLAQEAKHLLDDEQRRREAIQNEGSTGSVRDGLATLKLGSDLWTVPLIEDEATVPTIVEGKPSSDELRSQYGGFLNEFRERYNYWMLLWRNKLGDPEQLEAELADLKRQISRLIAALKSEQTSVRHMVDKGWIENWLDRLDHIGKNLHNPDGPRGYEFVSLQ